MTTPAPPFVEDELLQVFGSHKGPVLVSFLARWAAEARELAPRLGFPEAPSGR
jgi:thioredoxin-like negative regulator of GroEL